MTLDRPIFLIGAPRSGTTILFEALSRHEQVAWLSNYSERFPRASTLTAPLPRLYDLALARKLPRGEKKQHLQGASAFNRYLPKPSEAYTFWDRLFGEKFAYSYLIGIDPTVEEKRRAKHAFVRLVKLQGRKRSLVKLTGPSRIEFLRKVFPDARFVHVIRDGRAVVASLMKVKFWRQGGGWERPWWRPVPFARWDREWERYGRSPAILAGLQWKYILEVARRESASLTPASYLEIRYEDFVASPVATLREVLRFAGLGPSEAVEAAGASPGKYKSMNKKFEENLESADLLGLEEILHAELQRYGYLTPSRHSRSKGARR